MTTGERTWSGASRSRAVTVALVATLLAACGNDDPGEPDLAQPSAECEEAFADAAAAGAREDVDEPRSPDLDALRATLEACGTADAWLTAARGAPPALPLELDRETALDLLCDRAAGTPVCTDWTSSGSGAG